MGSVDVFGYVNDRAETILEQTKSLSRFSLPAAIGIAEQKPQISLHNCRIDTWKELDLPLVGAQPCEYVPERLETLRGF